MEEADHVDIIDFIVRHTHTIWQEKGLGLIYDLYVHNVMSETSDGIRYGRDAVISACTRVMSAFPDVRLMGDEVIWSGNDQDGYHLSHRFYWTGTNTGYSVYGPPTNQPVHNYGIAHRLVKQNRVVQEWIAQDEMALVLQLGFNPHALARHMARAEVGLTDPLQPVSSGQGEVERMRGQQPPPSLPEPSSDAFDVEAFVRRAFHEIWNWRLLNKIDDYFVRHYWVQVPGHRTLYGRDAHQAYILMLLGAFSDLALQVDHVCSVENSDGGYRVATRWTMQGTHDGPGPYGDPTGKRVRLLGITHQHVENEKITREWMIFDEFALLKQLYRTE